MQYKRLIGAVGLAAALGLSLIPAAPAAHAEPLARVAADVRGGRESNWRDNGWRQYSRHHWDQGSNWYQRSVVIQPYAGLPQPLTVRVVVPQPTVSAFALPPFVNVVQQSLLPALTQVVPAEALVQAPLRFVQVQPSFWVVAHPSLYWGGADAWQAAQYANWLQAYGLSMQPYAFNGPQGYGTYLAFQGGYPGSLGY